MKPLRIFMQVSDKDLGATAPEDGHHNWVMANDRTADALKAKGYDYRYVFSLATNHCDPKVTEQLLAEALVWTWKGYKEQ